MLHHLIYLDTNSLQSPEEPIETSLYQFDWRRDELTQKATDRITKDFSNFKISICRCSQLWNASSTPPNTPRRTPLVGGGGSPKRDTVRAAPATATQAERPQTQNQAPPKQITKIRIKRQTLTVNMWGDPPKNRRLTPKEKAEEIQDSIIWDHYPRDYLMTFLFIKT